MAGFSPNVADPELRRIIRALDGEVKKLGQRLTDQATLIRRLQSQPAQQTTVVQQVSGGGSTTGPGQVPDDVLGALLPISDPPASASVPPGMIIAFGGSGTPDGWLYCDGSSYPVSEYPDLHDAIGYTWGGSGPNFNVPDGRDRYLQGASGDEALGDYFGNADHEVDLLHDHDQGSLNTDFEYDHDHGSGTLAADSDGNHSHTTTGTTNTAGAHNHGGTGTTAATTTVQTGIGETVPTAAHTHSVSSDGSHSHTTSGTTNSTGAHTHTVSGLTGEAGGHSHFVTGTTGVALTYPVDIRPQSAAVRFLIKT